ncbi:MAG: enoyl-CoA hydratase-related protein [Pseudomonadota bacterium]
MGTEVHYRIHNAVAVLTVQRGASNALVPDVRRKLSSHLSKAINDDAVKAIVLAGAGQVFSTGVDVTEYDAEPEKPWINDLAFQIEESPKPVVAAIKGNALGAAFELALAAHARVAQSKTKIGLPEVRLGIVPNGGSTQRLPRILGAQASLELLLSGSSIPVEDARLKPMINQIIEASPEPAAVDFALGMTVKVPLMRTRDVSRGFSDPEGYQRAITAVETRLSERNGISTDILRCVRAAQLLPFESGLEFEQSAFEDRLFAKDAKSLRHVYASEWRARTLPINIKAEPKHVDSIVVVGSDTDLSQDILFCVQAGQSVLALSADSIGQTQLKAGFDILLKLAVKQGKIDDAQRERYYSRVTFGTDQSVLRHADVVLDAGDIEFDRGFIKPGTIWCVVNEHTPLKKIREDLQVDPIGLRRYRPVFGAALSELATRDDINPDSLATVFHYFSSNGDTVLCCGDNPGLIGQRLITTGLRSALALITAGADVRDVEQAAKAIGFPQGFLFLCDRMGIEKIGETMSRIFGQHAEELNVLDDRAEDVSAGLVSGTGFCVPGEQTMMLDPELQSWFAAWREDQDDRVELPDVPLKMALHTALVNEATKMIEEETVKRVHDIDLCMVKAFGFAPTKGGVLLQADEQGLLGMLRAMSPLCAVSKDIWTPSEKIQDMVKNGEKFFS